MHSKVDNRSKHSKLSPMNILTALGDKFEARRPLF